MKRHFTPVNLTSPQFLEQLGLIEPGIWGTPCSVTLFDGSAIEICLAWENKRFSDEGKWLNPEKVYEVRECRSRMPATFARRIRDAGESGMGYHIYVVELADGTGFIHAAGNLTIDLLNLPSGYLPNDVVNVWPHQGREQSAKEGFRQVGDFCSLEFARSP